MAFLVYRDRYKGKLCEVISHQRAEKLTALYLARNTNPKITPSLKAYLDNVKQISLGKPTTKTPVITDISAPNYDERYR